MHKIQEDAQLHVTIPVGDNDGHAVPSSAMARKPMAARMNTGVGMERFNFAHFVRV